MSIINSPNLWVLDIPGTGSATDRDNARDAFLTYFGLTTTSNGVTSNPFGSSTTSNSYSIDPGIYETDTGNRITARVTDSDGNVFLMQPPDGDEALVFDYANVSKSAYGASTNNPIFFSNGTWTFVEGGTPTFTDGDTLTMQMYSNIADARVSVSSTVQISIPTESINETFTLTDNLSTATTLRDNLFNLITQPQITTTVFVDTDTDLTCLLYTSPSPRDS